MKQINFTLLAAGILFGCFFQVARADVLDNWTTNQITTNSFGLHHVVFGNGCFVAVGESGDAGRIYTSTDGLKWTTQFSDFNSWGMTLHYANGYFAGIGGNNYVNVSTNGTNWVSTHLAGQLYSYNYAGNCVTYGHSLYVAVGDINGIGNIITSADGVTWTSRSISPSTGGRIFSVVYGGNRFVAVGNNDGYEYTSTGFSVGTNWTQRSIPGGNKISYGNGLFIVPLNNKTNLISTDGISWSFNSTGLTNQLGFITYGNGLFMAQCAIALSGSYLATSVDGTNWFQYAKKLPNYWDGFDSTDFDVSLATDGNHLVNVGARNQNLNFPQNPNSYCGVVMTSDVLVGVRTTNNPTRKVVISGLVGRNYQIQSADSLGSSSNWRTNTSLQLTNTPFIWTDVTATNAARFYRAVLMP